jgi:ribosomal protein L11 methyltransferase
MDGLLWEIVIRYTSANDKHAVLMWLQAQGIFDYVEGFIDGIHDATDGVMSILIASDGDYSPVAIYRESFDEAQDLKCRLTAAFQNIDVTLRSLVNTGWQQAWNASEASFSTDMFQVILDADKVALEAGKIAIYLAEGSAFGNGQHATTRACLRLLESSVDRIDRASVLDVGTGNGILAVAIAKLGQIERVVATDIESMAVAEAQSNFCRNGVVGEVILTDLIPSDGEPYTFVVCNILLPELLRLIPHMTHRLANNALLLTAGYLLEDAQELIAAASAQNLDVLCYTEEHRWAAHLFQFRGPQA